MPTQKASTSCSGAVHLKYIAPCWERGSNPVFAKLGDQLFYIGRKSGSVCCVSQQDLHVSGWMPFTKRRARHAALHREPTQLRVNPRHNHARCVNVASLVGCRMTARWPNHLQCLRTKSSPSLSCENGPREGRCFPTNQVSGCLYRPAHSYSCL